MSGGEHQNKSKGDNEPRRPGKRCAAAARSIVAASNQFHPLQIAGEDKH
jgi:hypothetical protein